MQNFSQALMELGQSYVLYVKESFAKELLCDNFVRSCLIQLSEELKSEFKSRVRAILEVECGGRYYGVKFESHRKMYHELYIKYVKVSRKLISKGVELTQSFLKLLSHIYLFIYFSKNKHLAFRQ